MMTSKLVTLAITAALSLSMGSHAIPTTQVETRSERGFQMGDTSAWASVDFQGKTIHYDPARVSFGPPFQTRNSIAARTLDNDDCGASTFSGTAAPWAVTTDCAAIRDWAYAQNTYFSIWTSTPDYHGIVYAGTCAFGAGTENYFDTYVGSSDIGDVTRDGINQFQVRSS